MFSKLVLLSALAAASAGSYGAGLLSVADVDIMQHRLLGQGHFGVVYEARLVAAARHPIWQQVARTMPTAKKAAKRGLHVAVKVANTDAAQQLTQLLLEARVHASLQHPHLVAVLGVQESRMPPFLAMELCQHGNLLQLLRTYAREEVAVAHTTLYAMGFQVASALAYLHSHLLIHRDLAARNVLVASLPLDMRRGPDGLVMKLSDLGLTRGHQTVEDYYRVRWPGGGAGQAVGPVLNPSADPAVSCLLPLRLARMMSCRYAGSAQCQCSRGGTRPSPTSTALALCCGRYLATGASRMAMFPRLRCSRP